MPIRKRITDPYSQETRDFDNRRKYGRPPPAPKKPTLQERKPFVDDLEAIPVGKSFTNAEWRDRYIVPYLRKQHELFGARLAIYPTSRRGNDNRDLCTGVLIRMLDKDERTGQHPQIMLKATGGSTANWYGHIIRWIRERKYGG